MSVKVFVSHSTWAKQDLPEPLLAQIPAHAKFREAVCDRLSREANFEVLVDQDIPPAVPWRERLFGALADCNAAVILINQQALLHSPWVDTEARILAWRAWVDRASFRLIMILYGGVTRQQLAQHRDWEAIAPAELQMLPTDKNGLDISNPAAVADALEAAVGAIRPLAVDEGPAGGESQWLLGRLTGLLAFEPAALSQLAQKVNIKAPGAMNEISLRRAIARQLYDRGPNGLKCLLESSLVKAASPDLEGLLDLLSTYWIDPAASTALLKFRNETAVRAALAINGALHHFTPQAYVRHVCGSAKPWPVIHVDVKRSLPEVLAQVREGLKDRFWRNLKTFPNLERASPDEIDQRLNEVLRNRLTNGAPSFVALPPAAAGDAGLIDALTNRYKDLRIILCSGKAPGATPLPGLETLQPELDLDKEKAAFKEYDFMNSEI